MANKSTDDKPFERLTLQDAVKYYQEIWEEIMDMLVPIDEEERDRLEIEIGNKIARKYGYEYFNNGNPFCSYDLKIQHRHIDPTPACSNCPAKILGVLSLDENNMCLEGAWDKWIDHGKRKPVMKIIKKCLEKIDKS